MNVSLPDFLRTFNRDSLVEHVAKAAAKRSELVQRFPKAEWPTMPLERYALGTPNFQQTFCYSLEYDSTELGSIAGGNAKKHLIYWKRDPQGWVFDTSAYKSAEQAWGAIRAGFVEALRLGDAGKFVEVDEIPALLGARVLRVKFLSIYFPSAILPVLSKAHLVHFLTNLGEEVTNEDSYNTVTLGQRLANKLAAIPGLQGWSKDELMALLYRWNPPLPEFKFLKIAPGEDGRFWDSDCRPQEMICVGWDDVGDLREYSDFASFRKAFEKFYLKSFNDDQSTVTRKANELWLLRDLGEGDLIAANHGIQTILAVGEVMSPGYVWDPSRTEFRHTVKVKWDLNRGGDIKPVKRWAVITVGNITGQLRDTVLALSRENPPSSPVVVSLNPVIAVNPTNLILYGPPGTGKTYHLQQLQAKYTETPPAKDREAWLEALVADFGWRAVIAVALDKLGRAHVPDILNHELVKAKARSNSRERNLSQTTWGYLQHHTPDTVATVQIGRRHPPFIFTKTVDSVWSLLPEWQANDEDSSRLATLYRDGPTNTAISIKRFRQVTFHPSYAYEDFVRGIRPVSNGDDDRTEFRMVDGVLKQICDEARANPTKRFALFIDEINRGNIAKIFGELITLIEPDKRLCLGADGVILSGMAVQLPGDGGGDVVEAPFGVPANLDLYGTMNTADRSIALLDIALRRRFEFREMEPRYDVFAAPIGGVNPAALLRRINDRLEYLLDRDHRIGHAYLMKVTTLDQLRAAFANQIIPLLQEFFFDDLAKVALVLSGPDGLSPFVLRESLRHDLLFPGSRRQAGSAIRERFVVAKPAVWTESNFVAIYAAPEAVAGVAAEEA